MVLFKTSISARDWFRIFVSRGGHGRLRVDVFSQRARCLRNILFDLGLGGEVLPFRFLHHRQTRCFRIESRNLRLRERVRIRARREARARAAKHNEAQPKRAAGPAGGLGD